MSYFVGVPRIHSIPFNSSMAIQFPQVVVVESLPTNNNRKCLPKFGLSIHHKGQSLSDKAQKQQKEGTKERELRFAATPFHHIREKGQCRGSRSDNGRKLGNFEKNIEIVVRDDKEIILVVGLIASGRIAAFVVEMMKESDKARRDVEIGWRQDFRTPTREGKEFTRHHGKVGTDDASGTQAKDKAPFCLQNGKRKKRTKTRDETFASRFRHYLKHIIIIIVQSSSSRFTCPNLHKRFRRGPLLFKFRDKFTDSASTGPL
jgi:hypothetical protein